MNPSCSRTVLQSVNTLSVHRIVPRQSLHETTEAVRREVGAYLERKIPGRNVSFYLAVHNPDASILEIDAGYVVESPVSGHGEILPDTIPAGNYVECRIPEGEDALGDGYRASRKWLLQNHLMPSGAMFLLYDGHPDGMRMLIPLE